MDFIRFQLPAKPAVRFRIFARARAKSVAIVRIYRFVFDHSTFFPLTVSDLKVPVISMWPPLLMIRCLFRLGSYSLNRLTNNRRISISMISKVFSNDAKVPSSTTSFPFNESQKLPRRVDRRPLRFQTRNFLGHRRKDLRRHHP